MRRAGSRERPKPRHRGRVEHPAHRARTGVRASSAWGRGTKRR